ncbi:hypothetical protein [Actinophytocola sp.]|uniref:hypothetical protein n=1 Tax=Actinophytocola sp. TaxID=1872138 RepID=UPI002ED4A7A2
MAQADALEKTRSVSDPDSPDYDPDSPHYDVTSDSSSPFYVGPVTDDHKSGDQIREEVTATIDEALPVPGGWLGEVFEPVKDGLVQSTYTDRVEAEREGLVDGMDLRSPGEAPRTMWENASHEQMVEIISSNADSAAVAVTSEEWVRLGNELAEHQKAFGAAINDSLSNWEGDAGDAARTHLAEVAKWLGGTANGAVLTGRQQEIHSQTLNETQKAMAANPPVPFSSAEANARLAQITNPVQYAMQFAVEMRTYHQQRAARDQAAQVMTRFDETIAGAATTPKFTAPPTLARATKMASASRPVQGTEGQATLPQRPTRMDGSDAGTDPARQDAAPGIPATAGSPGGGSVPQLPRTAGGPGGQGFPGGGSVPDIPAAGVPGGQGIPGAGSVPDIPATGIPGGQGVPGGGSVPGIPGTTGVPGGQGFPGGGSIPGIPGSAGVPGGQAFPGSIPDIPAAAQAPGGFQAGRVPDIPGTPGFSGGARSSVPEPPPFALPDTSPSGVNGVGGGGSTGASGFTPTVPDIPRGTTIPSGSGPGGGPSFVPPTFPNPAAGGGERTARMPTTRPTVPNLPSGSQIGGGSLGGRVPGGNVPGGGRIPDIPGGGNTPGGGRIPGVPGGSNVPGGGRFGPGGVPDIPGGSTSSGGSMGGAGSRGFGPTGGGMPGGGMGGGGVPGGGGAGAAAGRWGPVGNGASMGAGMVGEEPVARPGAQGSAGARGASGAGMPMGGMGGAGSQRDEEKEYKVAEYLEGDSELFAPDAVVHPPVIGDWANKQDWK